jgi:hypothetical protein
MAQFGPAQRPSLETIPSVAQDRSMPISFRQALDQDFDYCERLYFGEMEWIIKELHLDKAAQAATFQQQWGSDAGSDHSARRLRCRLVTDRYAG